jgi:serine/threonine protein kinase
MFYNAAHGGPPVSHLAKRPERAKEGDWSADIMDFLKQCLTRNAEKRPAAKDLLNHPFLKVADEPAEMKRILKLIFLSNSLQMQGIGI